MEKLDGVSCLLTIKNNHIYLTTRGDGETGKDITFLKYYINIFNNNTEINSVQDMYVRGEIVIQKDEKLQGKERQMVSGITNQKTIDTEFFK